ncbi:hypothetical protein HDU80_006355 [Chytriomyces hyalinus]|nr:hypothetical protein HDU80_006355 [Chytriomyces hyalinus]
MSRPTGVKLTTRRTQLATALDHSVGGGPKLDPNALKSVLVRPASAPRQPPTYESTIETSDGELRKKLKTSHQNQRLHNSDSAVAPVASRSSQSDLPSESAALFIPHPTPAQSVSPLSPEYPTHFNQMSSLDQDSQTAVPDHFHHAETAALTHMIADMLQRLTSHNDQIPLSSSTLTRFHSRAPPAISIVDYLRRIVKYASVERVCLLILLVYIDRVCERNRSFTISSLTVHRFIITGVTVACKALCDSFLQNSMYAKVGGISTKELNVLEIEFLTLIGWDLTASAERLQDYYRNLVRQHPGFRMVPHAEVLNPVMGVVGSREVGKANSGDWTGTSKFVEAAENAENQMEQHRLEQEQHQSLLLHLQSEQQQQQEMGTPSQMQQQIETDRHQLDVKSTGGVPVPVRPITDVSSAFYDGYSHLNSSGSSRREVDARMNA